LIRPKTIVVGLIAVKGATILKDLDITFNFRDFNSQTPLPFSLPAHYFRTERPSGQRLRLLFGYRLARTARSATSISGPWSPGYCAFKCFRRADFHHAENDLSRSIAC
jgi:hypothetical protein